MSNIEEDIKLLKKFNPGDEYTEKIKSAIEHILSEREAYKKRIKELEKENYKILENSLDVLRDTIPKQKVKEILDKAEVMDYYTLPDVIEDLEKLLEDK